jgi:hypothetical protein
VTEVGNGPEPVRAKAAWCVKCAANVSPTDRVTDIASRPARQRCRTHGEVLQLDAATPQPAEGVIISWTDISPRDAAGIALPVSNIEGPLVDPEVAEAPGQVCPWPWEPQQLAGVPLGMYHCRYCGSMVLVGVPHPDYRYDGMQPGGELVDGW